MGYLNNRNTDQGNGIDSLLKPAACPMRYYFPSWKNTVTRFRAFPAPDHQGGVQPYRVWRNGAGEECVPGTPGASMSVVDNDFSDWLFPAGFLVKGGADRMFSFFISDEHQAARDTAYHQLLSTAHKLKKVDIKMRNLLDGSANQGASLSNPRPQTLMQGMLLAHNGKSFAQAPKLKVILAVGKAYMRDLEQMLNEKNADGTLKYGDLLSPSGGFTINSKQAGAADGDGGQANYEKAGAGAAKAGDDDAKMGYDLTLYPEPKLNPNSMIPMMLKNWTPWNECVRYADDREQMSVICTAFNPEILKQAYRDSAFEELVPQTIRNIWARAVVSGGLGLGKPVGAPAQGVYPGVEAQGDAAPAQTTAPVTSTAPVAEQTEDVGANPYGGATDAPDEVESGPPGANVGPTPLPAGPAPSPSLTRLQQLKSQFGAKSETAA